jgi:ABC-type nitrate/sulfonate/bicarbonate transport system substrate-binding protein
MLPGRGRARRTLGLLLAGALLLASCGGNGDGEGQADGESPDAPPDEPVLIRLSWNAATSTALQISLMITNPELAPNLGTWYELEVTEIPGTAAAVQGLAAGTLDAGSVGGLTVANGLAEGAELVITGDYGRDRDGWGQSNWLVRKDSGITSVDDVAGKTVAVNQVGAYVDYVADYYLREEAGLEAGVDYEKVEIPFPQMQEALEAGQIDVGMFPAPFAFRALPTDQFDPLFTASDVQEEMIVILQAFRRGFVEEHEEVTRRFLEDYVEVSRYMADPDNRQTVIESAAETSQQPVEDVDAYLLTEHDNYRPEDGAVDPDLVQSNWDFFYEQGAFDTELNVEDYLMPELWPE